MKGQIGKANGAVAKPATARKTSGQAPTSAPKRTVVTAAPPVAAYAPTHDEVALLAYQLFEREGRQPGKEKELEYWLRAEAQVLSDT